MAWSAYAYAVDFDAALIDFTLFETTFSIPYLSAPTRIPDGSVTSKALSGEELTDGWVLIQLEQLGDPSGITLFADLDDFVTDVFGGWRSAGVENAEVSLKTRDVDGTFVYLNAYAHRPRLGEDYTMHPMDSRYAEGLKLRFTVMSEYTPA